MKPSKSYDATRKKALKDPKVAAVYLEECLRDGNMELFTAALKHVAQARGGGGLEQARVQDPRRRPPAAPATNFSSVSVITNALRLRRVRL